VSFQYAPKHSSTTCWHKQAQNELQQCAQPVLLTPSLSLASAFYCVTLYPAHSKFLARNTPLERLLKDHREAGAGPAGSEGSSALDVDDDRDSCDVDGSAAADMDDDMADAATQACADTAFTASKKSASAAATSTPAAQSAPSAAGKGATAAAAQTATAMSAGRGLRAAFGPSSAAAASVRRASACEASAAAGRASPTSSTHSEQCGVNNSAGHADKSFNAALTTYCQVRQQQQQQLPLVLRVHSFSMNYRNMQDVALAMLLCWNC
jgi:hypothetical protein